MKKEPIKPEIGKTCPALINEDYDTHLSGDLMDFCVCAITGKHCIGRVIGDYEDQSSRFFGRACCRIDPNLLTHCPLHSADTELIQIVFEKQVQRQVNERVAKFGK